MAGDWIKIEHITPDKPEVIGIAERVGIDPDAAFGKLVRLWVWADQQTRDGNVLSVTKMFVDHLTRCPHFSEAMEEVGWLAGENGRFSFPNFDNHNGKTAKNRAETYSRVKRHRNAETVTKALTENREQSKRKSKGTIVPLNPYSVESFEKFWKTYPALRRNGHDKAQESYRKALLRAAKAGVDERQAIAKIQAACELFSASPVGKSRIVPNPAVWLNQGRYNDDPATWQIADPRDARTPQESIFSDPKWKDDDA